MAETLMFDYHRQHGIGEFSFLAEKQFVFVCSMFCLNKNTVFVLLFLMQCVPSSAEIRIARIFNTYGPRMNIDDGRVVSNFIAQAVR